MTSKFQSQDGRLLYRVSEAARMMGVSRAYLYVLLKEGKLPVVRLGANAVRIPCDALTKWVNENTQQAA